MKAVRKPNAPRSTKSGNAEILRAVLDGQTYEAVALRFGVSHSAVERRVKALALELIRVVGVKGLKEKGAGFVNRLRQCREAILTALDQLDTTQQGSHRASRVLSAVEIESGAMRIKSRSSRPQHDLALYRLPFATGLRPLEVARLVVADYLVVDGSVRCESRVRADVAINGKARPLYFAHRRFDEAMAAYLDERLHLGHGLGQPEVWRGLDPQSPLFLGAEGEPYAITANGNDGQNRHVCRAMLEVYRKIFRHADIQGLCTQSARLTMMSRMYERGADEDQVGLMLGIADRNAVRGKLPRPRPQLEKLLSELV